MFSSTQILKGLLEGCILKIISFDKTYGYEICETLVSFGFEHVNEGIVYPILLRLEKKNLIYSRKEPSPHGPKRKYYYLTDEGSVYLNSFVDAWNDTNVKISKILGGNDD